MQKYINVIGGGLAGCEAAYHIAQRGLKVRLIEMRPIKTTPVHKTNLLAELVCSNSLKSELEDTAQGLLKKEMRALGSLLLDCADKTRIPAGSALAVDRELFAETVTNRIMAHPLIEVVREEACQIPSDAITIIATGPLTSDTLTNEIQRLTGEEHLYFYDAVAPIVTLDSLDFNRVFKASRYEKGTDDYYNCPMNQSEYETFYHELINADIKEGHSVDKNLFFNACMPVEVIARRGKDTLRYGPMRPVGLNPGKDKPKPYAVVQLRQEDIEGRFYSLVGFQTRIRWGEQDRIFRLIPGLKNAEFVRYGVMHRNTYINSPAVLLPSFQFKQDKNIILAGQITGVEGYMESAATGIIAGINAVRIMRGQNPIILSHNTMIGALVNYITNANPENFQPVNANFGLLPPLIPPVRDKRERYRAYSRRALEDLVDLN
ncbi:MAG: methylenetetrahydrofolate--tRNA-(uracil(54)-C(5))-methyltransferase (FADH(2)-oxidizing) TrmFO [Syntrophomonadaceae bacterium]